MKKILIIAGLLVLLLGGTLVWLAGSVGPDTAPQDLRTIDLSDSDEN
ncbi:MAG: hypothetical protein AAF311_05000 [Pseudomonadota bacterium]